MRAAGALPSSYPERCSRQRSIGEGTGLQTAVDDACNIARRASIFREHPTDMVAQVQGQLADGQIEEGGCIYRAFDVHAADGRIEQWICLVIKG